MASVSSTIQTNRKVDLSVKKRTLGLLVVSVLLVWSMTALANESEPFGPLPLTLDPRIPEHRQAFEPMHGVPFSVAYDEDGLLTYYMGVDKASVPAGVYSNVKYVVLKGYVVDTFTFEFGSRGGVEGTGNPSQFVIYGWEDYKNYHYIYVAETAASRVARVVDGKHETLYEPKRPTWVRDKDVYHQLKVTVQDGENGRYVEVWVDGELAMTYTFAEGEAPPAGRVGIGAFNGPFPAHFHNIKLRAE